MIRADVNRLSLDATKAGFVSVEPLKDGVAIRIEGGDKDLGMVISYGLAEELAHHLARLGQTRD